MPADAKDVRRRWQQMRADLSTWLDRWQVLADYFMPDRSNINIHRSPGAEQTQYLYDSTAARAPERLAASLHGGLTNPVQKWQSLRMRQEDLNKLDGTAAWLEEESDRADGAYTQSNFAQAIGEVYLEAPIFGTAVCLQEERRRGLSIAPFAGLRFTTLPIGTYALEEGADGEIDTCFRQIKMSARACVDRWGEDVGREVVTMAKEHPGRMVGIVHAVYPRPDRRRHRDDALNMAWASCYVLEEEYSGAGGGPILEEGGFREWPFAVFRWRVAPGEIYGRGPGHTAKPDVLTLNRLKELDLQALSREIDPVLEVLEDSIVGNGLSLNPGAINWVTQQGAIQVVESKRRHDIVMRELGDIRSAIEECFYASQLVLPGQRQMTAEEVRTRFELMQRMLGPAVGRWQSEGFGPMVARTLAIMTRRGAMPPPPMTLLEATRAQDADLDVVYEGPLARAMRGHDWDAIMRKQAWVSMYYPTNPEVADLFDLDGEGRQMAQIVGYPADLVRDSADVQRTRQQRAAAQAQQAKLDMLAGAADAVGQAGPGVKALVEAGVNGGPPA